MKTDEIRTMFLKFFQEKNHKLVPSSSLIAKEDETLLFSNAGMNQFKKIYLGYKKNKQPSITSAQYCIRTGGKDDDFKKVGYTPYHHTLFEMLGNFSFGEYFKKTAIIYAWEFLTDKRWLNLSKKKIWITYYYDDYETKNIWLNIIKIKSNHLIEVYDKDKKKNNSDNFWKMGDSGPCGPCTEIFYDSRKEKNIHVIIKNIKELKKYCVEIWNLVFMQFNQIEPGKLIKLPTPSIDTGMGLERISAVLQNVTSSYKTDTFIELIKSIKKKLKIKQKNKTSLRIIADHLRASTCLIAENIYPGNEGRNYVLRRIIRRALCHGYFIGLRNPFFYKLPKIIIYSMKKINSDFSIYKKLKTIQQVLFSEEKQFHLTLKRGIYRLKEEIKKNKKNRLHEEQILYLYDTFGLPIEITQEICKEKKVLINVKKLNKIVLLQRQNKEKKKNKINKNHASLMITTKKSIFDGYDEHIKISKIIQIIYKNQSIYQLSDKKKGIIILKLTPFYYESSGQIGDSGEIIGKKGIFIVEKTKKNKNSIAHIGYMKNGSISINEKITAKIDKKKRHAIQSNHTATHLLHAALNDIFLSEIKQQGSLIKNKYLRFDFTYGKPIKEQEIYNIEKIVNNKIQKNMSVNIFYTSFIKAKNYHAISLESKKYKNIVRVVDINNFSIELCNGTHHTNTGKIGCFKILSCTNIGNEIKRIIAITGTQVVKKLDKKIEQEKKIEKLFKTKGNNLYQLIQKLFIKINYIKQENKELQKEHITYITKKLIEKKDLIENIFVIIQSVSNIQQKMLRKISDIIQEKKKSVVIILINNKNQNNHAATFLVKVTKNITKKINALTIMKIIFSILPGIGGGKINMVEGKLTKNKINPQKIKEIKLKIINYIKK